MSLLDENLDIDCGILEVLILKYIKRNTRLNEKLNWSVIVDKNNIHDSISNPSRWYIYRWF